MHYNYAEIMRMLQYYTGYMRVSYHRYTKNHILYFIYFNSISNEYMTKLYY